MLVMTALFYIGAFGIGGLAVAVALLFAVGLVA